MKRDQQISLLKEGQFDILVIGGGATGAGIALDAASRGLKVAMVERYDFASGTSSRSTKLLHGGVRYLEQAVKKLDRGQYHLVKEALHERKILIHNAPHLAHPLAIITPLYKWYEGPYLRIGLKMYDWVAGKSNLAKSRFVKPKEALKDFPMLKKDHFKGAVLYYDGQFNDARFNLAIALTAHQQGAVIANYVQVHELIKNDAGKICGVVAEDAISGIKFETYAKVVINATGPYVDVLRKLDDAEATPVLKVSSGIHIVLDKKFCADNTGILIPKTEDGRVLFLLPWLEHTLVGTTDNPSTLQDEPKASEEDIQYILRHIEKYFATPVKREDVLASWCGLRPLVANGVGAATAKLSRDHYLEQSASGLITITGGKWTTYRKMALDAVNKAINVAHLQHARPSQTEHIVLTGAEGYHENLHLELIRDFKLEVDVAKHLQHTYGGLARKLLSDIPTQYHQRLVENHPFIEAEVLYALRQEGACRVADILLRRMRLGFLDQQASLQALPRVTELMAEYYQWDEAKQRLEQSWAEDCLN